MTTNPFDDGNRSYLVLTNTRNQPCVWPADLPGPAGWRTAHAADSYQACLDYVERQAPDPKPTRSAPAPRRRS